MNITLTGPPPKPQSNYGPPKPHSNYGPPKHQSYPAPSNLKPFYSLPNKPAVNFKPQQHQPQQHQPQQIYAAPTQQQPQQIYAAPTQQQPQVHQPIQQFGPPKQPLIHGAGCDGWKPIPNPHPQLSNQIADAGTITIQTQSIPNANPAPIQADLVESTYAASSNNLQSADNINLSVQPLPTNLQLPVEDALQFHDDSGLGLTNINVVKTEGFEVRILTMTERV